MAVIMRAFANPVRIEILLQLKVPRVLGEIRVTPNRKGGGRSDRFINRVTVKHHLDYLISIGAVQTRRLLRGSQYVDHYIVNHRQLFTLGEELHQMARIRPQSSEAVDGTVPIAPAQPNLAMPGAKLVLVNGTYEGAVFLLGPRPSQTSWSVGRRRSSTVCLDYDPYVSLEHAEIRAVADCFSVHDVPTARNRTRINWNPLDQGASCPLKGGDLIGVGRSLLLFLNG